MNLKQDLKNILPLIKELKLSEKDLLNLYEQIPFKEELGKLSQIINYEISKRYKDMLLNKETTDKFISLLLISFILKNVNADRRPMIYSKELP